MRRVADDASRSHVPKALESGGRSASGRCPRLRANTMVMTLFDRLLAAIAALGAAARRLVGGSRIGRAAADRRPAPRVDRALGRHRQLEAPDRPVVRRRPLPAASGDDVVVPPRGRPADRRRPGRSRSSTSWSTRPTAPATSTCSRRRRCSLGHTTVTGSISATGPGPERLRRLDGRRCRRRAAAGRPVLADPHPRRHRAAAHRLGLWLGYPLVRPDRRGRAVGRPDRPGPAGAQRRRPRRLGGLDPLRVGPGRAPAAVHRQGDAGSGRRPAHDRPTAASSGPSRSARAAPDASGSGACAGAIRAWTSAARAATSSSCSMTRSSATAWGPRSADARRGRTLRGRYG